MALADLDEAYAVQAALQALFAESRGPIAGHKIAVIAKTMQELCGVDHPIAAGIFANDIRQSPASVELASFHRLGIEFEIAATIGDRVPPEGAPYDADTIRRYVAEMRPAFELIEDRAADYSNLDGKSLAADNAWCGGIVLGETIDTWPEVDFSTQTATLFYNDEEPVYAETDAANPFRSLAFMANHLIGRGQTLEPGQVVMAGSAIQTRFPKAGDQIVYEIDGLARVEMRLF